MLAGAFIGRTGVNICPQTLLWAAALEAEVASGTGKVHLPPQMEQAGSTHGVRPQETPWPEAVFCLTWLRATGRSGKQAWKNHGIIE